jgi:hypothetical protein
MADVPSTFSCARKFELTTSLPPPFPKMEAISAKPTMAFVAVR